MKRYYYFSNSNLKFVEIENFKRKLLLSVLGISSIITVLVIVGFSYFQSVVNPTSQVDFLKAQNKELQTKLDDYLAKFNQLKSDVDYLVKNDQSLRLKVNLEPLKKDQLDFGVGGKAFDNASFTTNDASRKILSSLDSVVDDLTAKVNIEKNNYHEISKTLELNTRLYEAIPAIKPADGPYGDRFGMRYHPILKVRRMHNGIDILVNTGTPVYATGSGRIKFAGRKGGLGKTVIIDHGFGYTSIYGHLSRIKVKKGQRVTRGDMIALSGNTGRLSTGPHLHYEVRHNGIALNPRNFIFDDLKLFDFLTHKTAKEKKNDLDG
jgi:murein DD-endopeptidase MepM/ murein hydrolase activator NlpD